MSRQFSWMLETGRARECSPVPQHCQLPAVKAEWQSGRVRHLWESQLNWSRQQRTKYSNLAYAYKELSKFSLNRPHWADSVIELRCSSTCLWFWQSAPSLTWKPCTFSFKWANLNGPWDKYIHTKRYTCLSPTGGHPALPCLATCSSCFLKTCLGNMEHPRLPDINKMWHKACISW